MARHIFLILLIIITHQLSLCPSGTNNTYCLPCPTSCTTCSTQSTCTLCQIQYYQSSASICGLCPSNCLQCSSSLICTNCLNPYVLVNHSCSLCVIDNAISCSSTVAASRCASGYYLSGGYCNSCMLNCATCSSAFDCSACVENYYLNQTIVTCNPCPVGCSTCDQYTTACTNCQNGYQLSSQQCISVPCSINNCLYCSSAGVCKQCAMFYYWDGTRCKEGSSVTCQSGANGGLPTNCANSCSSFSFVSGNSSVSFRCKPRRNLYIDPVEYYQTYIYAFNDAALLNIATNSSLSLSEIQNGEYAYPLSGTITLSGVPNYYKVVIRIKYVASTEIALTLTASTPTSNQKEIFTLQQTNTAIGVELTSSIVHSYNLNISSNNTIQLVELLLRYSKCSSGCTICLNRQLCQLCDSPNYMLSYNCVKNCSVYIHFQPNRTCLNSCPNNYYQITNNSLRYCQACSSPCFTCSNPTLCLSCASPYFYYNYTCSLACPNRYYASSADNLCQPCVSPCSTCISQTVCLSCSQGFWNGEACSSSCLSGTFADSSTSECSPCSSTCLTCINSAITCTTCLSPLLYYNYQCLVSCPDRYYNNGGLCLECVPPCYLCSNQTNCLSCAYNYLLNTSCNPSCPINYFPDQALLLCTPCSAQCLTCTSVYSCTACSSGCLFSGQCPSVCPSTTLFAQTINSSCSCLPCVYPCSTCQNSSFCLSCVDGYLFSGSCLIECPSGYYPNSSNATCATCNSTYANCQTCSVSACILCVSNYYLLNGNCLATCPSGYYSSSQKCQLCVQPCLTCSDTSACLSCVWPYALLANSCVSDCSIEQVIMTIGNITQCVNCTSPCLSCTTTTTNCTYCRYGYYLHGNQCLDNCSNITPINTYYSETATLTCQTCTFPCLTCISQTNCLSCRVGYFNPVLYSCTQCSLGTYPLNSKCQPCPSSCTICYSSSFCAGCSIGYYLYLNFCINNASICQINGYYTAGQVCYSCLQPCKTCWVNAQNCTSCLSGYIFYSPNLCIVSCPTAYYQSNSQCLACSPVCATCISAADYCLSCATNYYLLLVNASCLTSCPPTTYQAGSACSLCQYPCLTCSSELVCLSCVTGVLIGSQCYSSCLSGYFAFNNTCKLCTSPCSQCSIITTNCTQCIDNYWLLNGTCLSSCPSMYFSETESAQCLNCVGLCKQCSSYINCTSCNSTYIYFFSITNKIGECVLSCPLSYYPTNNTCSPCLNTCLTCNDAHTCLTCSLLVQYQGQCLSECPPFMYSLDGVCANCSLPCANCTGPYTCTSCPASYLLVAGSSCFPGPNCPSGYYLYGEQCLSRCPSNYYNLPNRTCNNISCGTDYFMGADMFCYTTCPSGYIANSSYYCYYCPNCPALYFSLTYSIIRDSLYLYLTFTQTPKYSFVPRILLTPSLPYQSINYPMVLVGGTSFSGQTNMTFLLPVTYSITSTTLTVAFQDQMATFANPLQSPNTTLELEGYDYYPTNLPDWSGVGLLALTVALIGLGKNPYMTDFAQMLFLVGLVDCHYPSNLAGMLESTGLAHLHRLVSINQPGQIGGGKFLYLTGTGFLVNGLTNMLLLGVILGASGVVFLVFAVLRRRMQYSKVHQESVQEKLSESDKPSPCFLNLLSNFFEHFHFRCFLRVVYFNYATLSLFALLQLTNFDVTETINAAAGGTAAIVIVFLVFYPIYIRENKPKYTFLMLRKLLISGAVVLSLKDAIYAIGIMSVCNFTAIVLLYTYKLQKYRYQTRLLALLELLQLFVMIALCFFIIIGEGNSTSSKLTLCSIIIYLIVIILVLYLLEAVSQLVFWIYFKTKGEDLRVDWTLNSSLEEQESHHSESINGSVKDKQEPIQQQKQPIQSHNLETMFLQIKDEMRIKAEKQVQQDSFGIKSYLKPDSHPNQAFWAYQDSEKDENEVQKSAPKLLVRCVNEFSDLDGGSEGGS